MGLRVLLWIFFLALLWGPSFLFIKVAVLEIPPFTLMTGRVGIASLILFIILRVQGKQLTIKAQTWRSFAFMAVFANALPFVLFGWGEIYVDSALAAVLNGTTPIFTVIIAHFFLSDDRMNLVKGLGIALGFLGIVVLFFPFLSKGVTMDTLGVFAFTAAALCYGISTVYARKKLRGLPPLVAPTAQLFMATICLLPFSLIVDHPFAMSFPSWNAINSMLALSVFGSAIAFVVFYHILEMTSATNLSMVTYLIPVIGVILGVVFLHEKLGWYVYVGCAIILLGVMVVNGVFNQFLVRKTDSGIMVGESTDQAS